VPREFVGILAGDLPARTLSYRRQTAASCSAFVTNSRFYWTPPPASLVFALFWTDLNLRLLRAQSPDRYQFGLCKDRTSPSPFHCLGFTVLVSLSWFHCLGFTVLIDRRTDEIGNAAHIDLSKSRCSTSPSWQLSPSRALCFRGWGTSMPKRGCRYLATHW
jgi:hypothetical protein